MMCVLSFAIITIHIENRYKESLYKSHYASELVNSQARI